MPCEEGPGAQGTILKPSGLDTLLPTQEVLLPPAQITFPFRPFPFSIRTPFSGFILRVWRDGTEGG